MNFLPAEPPEKDVVGAYVDESHAWLQLTRGLLRTVDGGRTWAYLRPDQNSQATFGALEQLTSGRLEFLDAATGFLSTGRGIWKTIDGGSTWKLISRGSFADFHFFDAKTGWTYFLIDQGNRAYAQAHRTLDGGNTWQPCGPLVERDSSDLTAGADFDYSPSHAHFLNRDVGWATGVSAVGHKKLAGVLYTQDGGCIWKVLWENIHGIDPDEIFSDIYFVDREHGWLAGGVDGGIFATSDGGLTWQTASNPAYVPPVDSFYFQNLSEGWLISTTNQRAPMMQTADGGRTWKLLYSKDLVNLDLPVDWPAGRFLQMLSRNRGLAQKID